MVPFAYAAAPSAETAIARVSRVQGAEFIAGGTDMPQLLQERVREPAEPIDTTRPPSAAVARVALDAEVLVQGAGGERTIPVEQLHRVPGDTPHVETVLEPGDLITEVTIPASAHAPRSHYLKIRDRASFEFALASAAVAL